jgi:hypothetical protein
MKKIVLLLLLAMSASGIFAQKVDSIYFHLYTDSLKKGQHNYINVDGKLSNGRWLPLTSKEILFTCLPAGQAGSSASFEGNELIIPPDFSHEKVTVKAVLKSNPSVWIEKTIWIKQKPDPMLPTRDDMIREQESKNNRNKGKNR